MIGIWSQWKSTCRLVGIWGPQPTNIQIMRACDTIGQIFQCLSSAVHVKRVLTSRYSHENNGRIWNPICPSSGFRQGRIRCAYFRRVLFSSDMGFTGFSKKPVSITEMMIHFLWMAMWDIHLHTHSFIYYACIGNDTFPVCLGVNHLAPAGPPRLAGRGRSLAAKIRRSSIVSSWGMLFESHHKQPNQISHHMR